MKDLDKKSNKELQELKRKLAEDFEYLRIEILNKHAHWAKVKEAYNEVHAELRKRNVL